MSRIARMFTLIVAGEMIFGLPFHTARFFRPTLLDVFNFSNTQLGDAFAVYGVTAMLAYFPGGLLADYFSARRLLTASLIATAAGGVYMATIPGMMGMALLYGYWGITTILLFWGALIRATREWGGESSQGKAFGILEGGRGLAAALFAMSIITVFATYMPGDASLATDSARAAGFRAVILMYAAIAFGAGILTWLIIPESDVLRGKRRFPFAGISSVLRRPVIWAQAAVIVCAYCGYKGLDNYSLYAVQVLGMDEVEGAKLATYGAYIRVVAAIAAGLIADRSSASRVIGLFFVILIVSYGLLSTNVPAGNGLTIIYANLFVSFFAVYGLRGVYFALLQENKTPGYLTGTAVGVVSFVGYTPDIFFAPITGRLLDATPGVGGHQHYFLFLTGVATLGVIVVVSLLRLQRKAPKDALTKFVAAPDQGVSD